MHHAKRVQNLALAAAVCLTLLVLLPLVGLGSELLASSTFSVRWLDLGRLSASTAVLVATTTAIACAIGLTAAWVVSRFSFYTRSAVAFALFLPFAIPPYLEAFLWADLADRAGIGSAVRNPFGAAAVMAAVLYPYVYLFVRASFANQTGVLLASARILGCTPLQALLRVALPLARPAIAAGALLVAMETANDIAIAEDFGVATLGYFVYDSWLNRGDAAAAVSAAVLLAIFALAVSWGEAASRAAQRHHQTHARTFASEERQQLTGFKALAAAAICWLPVVIGFALPVIALLRHAWLAPLQAWRNLPASIAGTLLLIAGVIIVCYVLAAGISVAVQSSRSRLAPFLDKAARCGYALPGAVFSLGLLAAAAAAASLSERMFGVGLYWLWTTTPILLIFALAARYQAVAAGAIEAGRAAVPPSLCAAARSCGTTRLGLLHKVYLPLMVPALAASTILMAADIVKELPLTLILRPFGITTLAIETYSYASDEDLLGAATAALAMIVLVLIGLLLVHGKFKAIWRTSAPT